MAREVKRSFQRRLEKSIPRGDEIEILRCWSDDPQKGDMFQISCTVDDPDFGHLHDCVFLSVEKATPGGIAKAIEEVAGKIHGGADLVRAAKDRTAQ